MNVSRKRRTRAFKKNLEFVLFLHRTGLTREYRKPRMEPNPWWHSKEPIVRLELRSTPMVPNAFHKMLTDSVERMKQDYRQ